MGRPKKRQFFDFNIPSTTHGHLQTLVKFKQQQQQRTNTGKKERKIKEVKRAPQSIKENRTPKVKKLSGTQPKKKHLFYFILFIFKRTKTKQTHKTKQKPHKKEIHKVLWRKKNNL